MKTIYKGCEIEIKRDDMGVYYVVEDIFACDTMSEALSLINRINEEPNYLHYSNMD